MRGDLKVNIIKDSIGRVLITSNKPFGRYGYKDNLLKIKTNKSGEYVIINRKKCFLKNMHQNIYTWSVEGYKSNISRFYYIQK